MWGNIRDFWCNKRKSNKKGKSRQHLNGTQQRNKHIRKQETKRSKQEQFLRKKNTCAR